MAFEIEGINPTEKVVVLKQDNGTLVNVPYVIEGGMPQLGALPDTVQLDDPTKAEFNKSLVRFIEAYENPFVKIDVEARLASATEAEKERGNSLVRQAKGLWQMGAAVAGAGMFFAGFGLSGYMAGPQIDAARDAGLKDGKTAGHAAGIVEGFANGNATGQAYALEQVHADLEAKILGGVGGNWTHEKVNATAKTLFNKSLDNMSVSELAAVYAQLSFDSGRFSTPEATNATLAVVNYINSTWTVSKERLNGLDLFGAVRLYAQLSAHDAEAALRKAAGEWNASWYEKGQAEILAKVGAWNASQYQSGADSVRAAADIWNVTKYNAGKADGRVERLAELVGIVDDVLNQTEISGAGDNVRGLLNLYAQKARADALALTDYTAGWVLQQTDAGNLNETERALGRLEGLYGGFRLAQDSPDAHQSFMANLSENDSRELKQAGINASWMLNHGYALRVTDTFGDGGVVSAYSGDTIIRVKVSQGLTDRLKAWNDKYVQSGGQ